jgi:CheY-like chemotaxis protein
MASPVRVLVVDDQAIIRDATRLLLESTPDFRPVGEVASGAEALAAIERLDPDLVLLDVRMPEMDGIETARRLHARVAESAIVLISLDEVPELEAASALEGAVAYARKQDLSTRTLRELWATIVSHGR